MKLARFGAGVVVALSFAGAATSAWSSTPCSATPAGSEWICFGSGSTATSMTVLQQNDSLTGILYGSAIGIFKTTKQTGQDDGNPYIDFGSNTQDSTSSTGGEFLEFTEYNISDPHHDAVQLNIGLTENQLPKKWTVVEDVYESNSNTPFGLGTLLATDTFTSISSLSVPFTLHPTNSQFSLTEVYDIIVPSGGAKGMAQATINVTGAIPEASTWVMLGLGFAAVGLAGVAKRRKDSRYAF